MRISPHPGRRTVAGAVIALVLVLAGRMSSHPNAGTTSTASTSTTAARPPITSTSAAVTSTTARCAGEQLTTWSLERLAAQTVVVPVSETGSGAVASEVGSGVGGVILFGSSAPPDLGRQIAPLRASALGGIAPFVMTDEEGGAVQRLANVTGGIPSAREMGATMTPTQIEQLATRAARKMVAAGITMDLAPVLDVDGGIGPDDRDPDGTRSFGANAPLASAAGLAFAAGLQSGGIVPVAKHFPGLGGATGNTDVVAAATRPWNQLQAVGLVPFEHAVAARLPAIMVANATVPGLSALPAGVSPAVVTGVLRKRLGYRGLVLTDSLSAVALKRAGYTVPRAATSALAAGADMFLFNADATSVAAVTGDTIQAITAAVHDGRVGKARLIDAVSHILAAKGVAACPQ